MLRALIEILKAPPQRPVKTFASFQRRLKLRQGSRLVLSSVEHHIKAALHRWQQWDHHFGQMTLDNDVVFFNAPFHWFMEDDVARIEAIGGYVANMDRLWCYWHSCQPMAILFPADTAVRLSRAERPSGHFRNGDDL